MSELTREITESKEIVPTAIDLVSRAEKRICATMLASEEMRNPVSDEYFALLRKKMSEGIKVTRVGFGTSEEFESLGNRVHIDHPNYVFHRTEVLNDYRRMLLVDDLKLMFRKAGRFFYSECSGDIAEYRRYFEGHLSTK